MNKQLHSLLLLSMVFFSKPVFAGDVEIIKAEFERQSGQWTVRVTLKHEDSGWEHYADGWRVVGPDGTVYGHRTLYHPHENEQPFTRSLSGVDIPATASKVVVEAHDKVHGWSPDKLEVDLRGRKGPRYRILSP